ncbi:hypothetical protein RRF57_002972 [Xylaria bambusicola]|uniref:Uncharacterized protein n=1 Tax=Xylaria bambusicola TaxID=326684 RepID=A0AAN7Z2A9_9PEZI
MNHQRGGKGQTKAAGTNWIGFGDDGLVGNKVDINVHVVVKVHRIHGAKSTCAASAGKGIDYMQGGVRDAA